jgi:uncharacterized membrane protein YqiK
MFGDYSAKEILLWIGSMLVAAAIVILGAIWAVDALVAPRDLNDPLERQGGLKADQEPKKAGK